VREAEETERSINEARESYRPAATRASILYFVIADLALVSPMYQFSLAYFSRLFKTCVESSEQSEDVPTRLQILNDYTTDFVFRSVSRALFEEHKGLFSFLLAASIARHPSAGEVSEAEWAFFLRGPPAAAAGNASGIATPAARRPAWVGEVAWRALCYLEGAVAALRGLTAGVAAGPDAADWQAW
jgi:dynein heavy chain